MAEGGETEVGPATPEYVVGSFEEFHSVVNTQFHYGWMYRGMKDIGWKLIPSIGRYWPRFVEQGLDKADFLRVESDTIRIFRKQAARYLPRVPEDGWEVWSIAQHHGLPTRLMDWTYNPLVALFFAVEQPFDADSVIYALGMPKGDISIQEERMLHPLEITEEVRSYEPSHDMARVNAQSAVFTIQGDPRTPLWAPGLRRIRISNSARAPIKRVLFNYGITRKLLFPELDGIADWLIQMKFGMG